MEVLALLLEKKQQSLLLLGRGMIGHFGCAVSLLLSLFRLDDGVVLLLPCSIMVTESPCLVLIFCKIVYICQGHIRA